MMYDMIVGDNSMVMIEVRFIRFTASRLKGRARLCVLVNRRGLGRGGRALLEQRRTTTRTFTSRKAQYKGYDERGGRFAGDYNATSIPRRRRCRLSSRFVVLLRLRGYGKKNKNDNAYPLSAAAASCGTAEVIVDGPGVVGSALGCTLGKMRSFFPLGTFKFIFSVFDLLHHRLLPASKLNSFCSINAAIIIYFVCDWMCKFKSVQTPFSTRAGVLQES
ncbi:hypothetical protein HPP92_012267 [Vanilla planifolia]|uniref:Uncharacterized protein n=1 Tax=Vanilla planifolia TaxID=51239 RepID=A0A835R3D6_VANPL|nr:hypothetical protein HPP92_012267 [Vanilla planifolia]